MKSMVNDRNKTKLLVIGLAMGVYLHTQKIQVEIRVRPVPPEFHFKARETSAKLKFQLLY